jgi:NAD(P)-dependent dehydrogenase (short-subunit alcohol dehydrogenase family)
MAGWQDRVAVITGAGSPTGIGAGLARHAAGLGMRVFAVDVDTEGLAELASRLGPRVVTREVDVRDGAAMDALAGEIFSETGAVHLLFNNAGVLVDGKSWERSEKQWRWNFDVNVMGVVNGIRAFVPRMLAQGADGRVVNTSSIGGLLGGGTFLGPYQGSKHAVAAITETLYQELQLESAPVTASCLCPGDVATGIWESERLQPVAERRVLHSEAEQQFHDQVAGGVASGLTADQFAPLVFAGIEADRFWILPQPDFKPLYQLRVDSIMNETSPPSVEEVLASYSQLSGRD